MTESNQNGAIRLDGRLACAASMVRPGAVVADVGTDHAYIPIYLLREGICPFAVASDINEGPLMRARMNAEKYGVLDRMRFVLTDGLTGLEPERDGVSDIVICGMGGELIAKILDASPYVKREEVRLILQPMTCGDELRRYLWDHGFSITDERLCTAVGKTYTCLCVHYTGKTESYTDGELLLGKINIERGGELFQTYAEEHARRLRTRIVGLKKGGLDPSKEEACLREMETILGGMTT